jgi:hypothetical protein
MVTFRSIITGLAVSWIAAGAALVFAAVPLLANPQGGTLLPVNGPWTSGDYVQAIFAVHNGDITLPRQGNPKTEAFFGRLVDRGNIEFLMASSRPVEEKSRQVLIILSATGEFRGRYGYAVALGDDVQNELVQIQIFRLYLIDRLAALTMRDQTGGTRVNSAVATTLSGTLDTLADTHIFSQGQRVALGLALALHYPAIRTSLDGPDRQAISMRLAQMAAAENDPVLRSAFAAALTETGRGN